MRIAPRLVPWMITALVAVYVFQLEFLAKNQDQGGLAYDFYDTTQVRVHLPEAHPDLPVYGEFNNVLEGDRKMVQGQQMKPGMVLLSFHVNSPRPARILVGEQALNIILLPGDTTLVIFLGPEGSLRFEGEMAPICRYYERKSKELGRSRLRAEVNVLNRNLSEKFAARLDSSAAKELAFLSSQRVLARLPDWFVNLETSEILYQKAYLKLNLAEESTRPVELDQVALNNEAAVFSYFYYLYLRRFFDWELSRKGVSATVKDRLSLANEYLIHTPRDMYFTRELFALIENNHLEQAEALCKQYQDQFSSRKYVRFLFREIRLRQET